MTKVIAVASSKGGIGKTTTSVNVSARLAHYDNRVLLIDADSQGQAADHLGVTPTVGLFDFVTGDIPFAECLTKCRENLFLLGGGQTLAKLEKSLALEEFRAEETLRNALTPANDFFDYIVIDCAPSWSIMLINILVYANEILTPIPLESLAVGGLAKFLERIQPILKITDNQVRYVVPTMVDKRFAQSSEIMERLDDSFSHLLTEPIRIDVRLSEAPGHGETIFEYAPTSRGAADYDKLTQHIINNK